MAKKSPFRPIRIDEDLCQKAEARMKRLGRRRVSLTSFMNDLVARALAGDETLISEVKAIRFDAVADESEGRKLG